MKKVILFIFLSFILCVPVANALDFDSPWNNIDNYTLDLTAYDTNLTAISGLNALGYTGWGYVDIRDTDGSGGVSAGDEFTDYIVYQSNAAEDAYGTPINGAFPTIGTGAFQIGLVAELEGHVSSVAGSVENFTFDSLTSAEFYIDSATDDTAGITWGSFGTAAGLGAFVDGTAAITGTQLVDGSADGNNGYLAIGTNGQGKYQVAMGIEEQYEGLFKDASGTTNLFDIWNALAFYPDGDLTRKDLSLDNPVNMAVMAAFQEYFGLFPGANSSYIYTMSDSHGSIDLGAVPEPGTMILLGIGMIGFAAIGRKKVFKA